MLTQSCCWCALYTDSYPHSMWFRFEQCPIHTLTHIIPALPLTSLLMQATGKLLYLNNYTTIPTNERWCKSQREILSHNKDQLDRPQRRARWLMIAHIRLNSSGTGCMHYALSKPSLIAPILMKKHTQSITVQQSVQSASPSLPPSKT